MITSVSELCCNFEEKKKNPVKRLYACAAFTLLAGASQAMWAAGNEGGGRSVAEARAMAPNHLVQSAVPAGSVVPCAIPGRTATGAPANLLGQCVLVPQNQYRQAAPAVGGSYVIPPVTGTGTYTR